MRNAKRKPPNYSGRFLKFTSSAVLCTISMLGSAETWEQISWRKQKELSAVYGSCVAEQLPDLNRISFDSAQPKSATKALSRLQRLIAEQGSYFERNALQKHKPVNLFKRARKTADIARKVNQTVKWQKAPIGQKTIFINLQICYLNYHRDLRNMGYSNEIDRYDGRERLREEESKIYNVARNLGASKGGAMVASVLGKRRDKVKKLPWRALPKFFDRQSIMSKVGDSFTNKRLDKLNKITLHLRGLKNSCACLSGVDSETGKQGYCDSVATERFADLLKRHEEMIKIVLADASKASPPLFEGDNKAKLRLSQSPDLANHLELMNSLRSEDKVILKNAQIDVEDIFMRYLDSADGEALSCALEGMNR